MNRKSSGIMIPGIEKDIYRLNHHADLIGKSLTFLTFKLDGLQQLFAGACHRLSDLQVEFKLTSGISQPPFDRV